MARPLKTGLEYFSHDVSLSSDDKIQFIEAKHGIIGYAVFCKLLEKIYKNGYYTKWEQRDEILFAKTNSVDVKAVREIVSDCINEGLFSAKLYNEFNVLTSRSIQLRYILGSQKRRNIYLVNDFLCVSDTETSTHVKITLTDVSGEITEVISPESTQSKVKESKENKSSVCKETHTHDFENFHTYVKQEDEYTDLKNYNLKYYFDRVINFYPDKKFTDKELKAKIIFFIGNDKKSDKHYPVQNPLKKNDSVTVAYELVKNNLDWIKNLPDKNPDEVIPQLVQKCRDPATKDALFEAYVEKALRHYMPSISN
ncbi:MAG: DUF4373 domain-containing protein [Bacteroidetes bacterium]|nr:DUF4373 domain-containing protein [Bacteroidota bacterium]